MKKLNKLLYASFISILLIFPIFVYAYPEKVYLGGENVGIEVNSKGALVVGFYEVNGKYIGKDSGLEIGDIITKIEDKEVKDLSDFKDINTDKSLNITYLRDDKEYSTSIYFKEENGVYKSGLFIKDKIVGIGTLTFINPENNIYGALGHQINESTTGIKFEIKSGKIFRSEVTDIERATKESPGEKNAEYYIDDVYGNVIKNTETGIYGKYNDSLNNKSLIFVSDAVKLGKAYIKTVISGSKVEDFEINIININKSDSTKNILFEITDENLISKTNGIIQGMSGSPIIQNNKIIGAVTHVIVDEPKKGYGIFITNMLKDAN